VKVNKNVSNHDMRENETVVNKEDNEVEIISTKEDNENTSNNNDNIDTTSIANIPLPSSPDEPFTNNNTLLENIS
jgi:hypothetical protein